MRYYSNLLLVIVIFLSSGCKQDERALTVSKIQNAAKLATTETTLSKVVLASQDRKFIGIIGLGKAKFAARTKAVIKAGIDLKELKKEDVVIEGTTIQVKLPHVRVIDFDYPFESYEIDYTITHNAFANKITVEDHERIYRMAELEIRKNLEFTGIKEATEARTRLLLRNLLKTLGYTEIYLEFKEGQFIEAPDIPEDEMI